VTSEDKKKLKIELHNLRDKVFMPPECEIALWEKQIDGQFIEKKGRKMSYLDYINAPPHHVGTASGRLVNLIDPKLDTIYTGDIITGMCHINRYAGQTETPYTLAAHTLFLYTITGEPWALLHDAHEVYIGDVASPARGLTKGLKRVYNKLDQLISLKYGVPIVDLSKLDKLCVLYELAVTRGELQREYTDVDEIKEALAAAFRLEFGDI